MTIAFPCVRYQRPLYFLFAALLVGNVLQARTIAPDSLFPAREFSARGGLPNFFKKVSAGKEVSIAFLGGSITRAGNGYRDQVLNWFRSQYPAARFKEIMAAVSGTASDFGACRVQQHVIDDKPDLVFVEFAVNDNGMRMLLVRETMEGIVRQIWKANPRTDICFIYTLAKTNLPVLQSGLFPPSVSAMESVAAHYNIPSIHLGLAVIDEIGKGKMLISGKKEDSPSVPLFSLDGIHPLPETGHKIYTDVLSRNMLIMKELGRPGKHGLKAVLEKNNWDNAGMTDVSDKQLTGNWGITDSVTKGREYYPLQPTVYGTRSDSAVLTVHFKGTRFGLADIMGPGTSAIEITIDNDPPRIINRFDAFCTYNRYQYLIISGLAKGKHVATVRLSKKELDKAAILKTRDVTVKDWAPYQGRVMYVGGILR